MVRLERSVFAKQNFELCSIKPISDNLVSICYIDTPCENCEDMRNSGSFCGISTAVPRGGTS